MRLSDFKGEKGIEVVGKLLGVIPAIAANEKIKSATDSPAAFASALLTEAPKETMTMLAILNDTDPNAYECDGATVFFDIMNLISDPALLKLFGLQGKIPASSSSASESTEAGEEQVNSSSTAQRGTKKA